MNDFLLVCDLDGTLLKADGSIDEESLVCIRKFCELGGNFVICTGRLDQDIEFVEERLGFKGDFRISQNGAVIKNRSGKVLYHEKIAKELVPLINKSVFSKKIRVEISDIQHRFFPSPRKPEEVAEFVDTSLVVEDLPEFSLTIEPTIYLIFGNSAVFEALQPELNGIDKDKLNVVQTSLTTVEVMSKSASKGKAVAFIMNYLKISAKKLFVAGDAESDTSMFPLTKNSFAVAKADPTTREKAVYYAENVGQIIQKYILKKEQVEK